MTPALSASITAASSRFTRRHWLWIGVATALGAGLRLWGLDQWSFWVDEGHTWRDATMPLTGEEGFLASDRVRYGVPFFLLRLLLGLGVVGYDEASVRLPFALIGVLTVPVIALCGGGQDEMLAALVSGADDAVSNFVREGG